MSKTETEGSLPDGTVFPASGKDRHGYNAAGMPAPSPEEVVARRQRRRSWFGYLADDTVEHIAERIGNLLNGRRYTFVSLNTTQVHTMPEVRTGQRLTPTAGLPAIRVHRHGEPLDWDKAKTWESAGISVSDTYGSWGMHASHATEVEARADSKDPERVARTTYVSIEGGASSNPREVGSRDRIEIRQYNHMSPRECLHWVIAIEPTPEEDQ